jgi:hypothetical protein
MHRHYWPSLLILRGKPKRRPIRIRTASANNRVRDQRLEDLERSYDRLMRERSALISGYLQAGVDKERVVGIEEEYRKIATQIELNREQINGIRAREVPIMDRQKKENALGLLSNLAEEMHAIRDAQRLLRLDIEALKAREVGSE